MPDQPAPRRITRRCDMNAVPAVLCEVMEDAEDDAKGLKIVSFVSMADETFGEPRGAALIFRFGKFRKRGVQAIFCPFCGGFLGRGPDVKSDTSPAEVHPHIYNVAALTGQEVK